MTETIKSIGSGILAGLVVLLGSMVLSSEQAGIGGIYENVIQEFSEGISVDEVTVIDGDRYLNARTPVYAPGADATLTLAQSGSIIAMNTAGQDITLPPASEAIGANYNFVVTAAVATTNMTIVADPADTFEGSLIVAGAVVTCDAGDVLTFVIDGENIGDYVEVYSDGTSWLVGDSGVLTAAKLTCSG